tara:strand:- start:122 stop:457 length:336 start_codon:yes stop_codon:yes gene_type:complete
VRGDCGAKLPNPLKPSRAFYIPCRGLWGRLCKKKKTGLFLLQLAAGFLAKGSLLKRRCEPEVCVPEVLVPDRFLLTVMFNMNFTELGSLIPGTPDMALAIDFTEGSSVDFA